MATQQYPYNMKSGPFLSGAMEEKKEHYHDYDDEDDGEEDDDFYLHGSTREAQVYTSTAFTTKSQQSQQDSEADHEVAMGCLDWSRCENALYGRTEELEQLEEALDRAQYTSQRSKKIQTVSITGICGGTGKSALIDAFYTALVDGTLRQADTDNVIACRARFENCASDHVSSSSTSVVVDAVNELLDVLDKRIELAATAAAFNGVATKAAARPKRDHPPNPDDLERDVWMGRFLEAIDDSEIRALRAMLPTMKKFLPEADPTEIQLPGEISKAKPPPGTPVPSFRKASASSTSIKSMHSTSMYQTQRTMAFQGPRERENELRIALRSLVQVLSQHLCVVMLVDDLQWANANSLRVLETLLFDANQGGRKLLFVCTLSMSAAIDEKARVKGHPFQNMMDRLNAGNECHESLCLDNLPKSAVSLWLQELLRREQDDIDSLADVVHKKTAGNPFFIQQFLRLLHHEKLLFFCTVKMQWSWHTARIQSETDISDNLFVAEKNKDQDTNQDKNVVIDVVMQKMRWLNQDQQMILIVGACLGMTRWDLRLVRRALQQKRTHANDTEGSDKLLIFGTVNDGSTDEETNFRGLVEHGLLEQLSATRFKFSHDSVREGAYRLIPNEMIKKTMHYRIGKRLWKMYDKLSIERQLEAKGGNLLLQLVRQLNLGAELVADEEEKVALAELNYQAAELAMERSSFVPASEFLQQGISLLGTYPWQNHLNIMENLCSALTRAEYCCGRIEGSLAFADRVIANAHSFEYKIDAYRTKILCLTQLGRGEEALKLNLSVLKMLGISFPKVYLSWHVRTETWKTRKMVSRTSLKALENLPEAPFDPDHETKVDFLERLFEVSVHGQHPHPHYMALVTMLLLQMTLKRGRTVRTSYVFVLWGWYLASLGMYWEAMQYGKIGLSYAKRNEGEVYDSRANLLYHNYIYHWGLPYSQGIDPVSTAIKSYWAAGAVELVHTETIPYLSIYFCTGLRLGPLMTDIIRFTRLMRDYHYVDSVESSLPFFQMIANLMGKAKHDPTTLTGEFMDEGTKLKAWTKEGNERALQKFHFHKMMIAYFYGNSELAWKSSQKLWSIKYDGPDVWIPYRLFYEGLISFAEYQRTGERKHRSAGKAILDRIEKWVEKGVVNCHHMHKLLMAEHLVCQSAKSETVRAAYDTAISMAARSGFMHTQALAIERAGLYFAYRAKDEDWATVYLERARETYNDWGGIAKSMHISDQFRGKLALEETAPGAAGGDFRAKTRLDLMTVAHHGSLRLSKSSFADQTLMTSDQTTFQ